jgi:hypothetical protein
MYNAKFYRLSTLMRHYYSNQNDAGPCGSGSATLLKKVCRSVAGILGTDPETNQPKSGTRRSDWISFTAQNALLRVRVPAADVPKYCRSYKVSIGLFPPQPSLKLRLLIFAELQLAELFFSRQFLRTS